MTVQHRVAPSLSLSLISMTSSTMDQPQGQNPTMGLSPDPGDSEVLLRALWIADNQSSPRARHAMGRSPDKSVTAVAAAPPHVSALA